MCRSGPISRWVDSRALYMTWRQESGTLSVYVEVPVSGLRGDT